MVQPRGEGGYSHRMETFGRVRRSILALCLAFVVVALARPFAAVQTGPRRVSLIVANGIVVTMDPERRVLSPGSIAIDGRDIVAVDAPSEIAARFAATDTIDASGQVVIPGLINTHTHAPMVLYRGLADDLALMDWLQRYIFPAESKTVSPEFVRAGTRLALAEMIQSGTTTFADMYYFEEEIAKVTKAAGVRGVLGQTVIEFPVADAKTPQAALERAETFIKAYAKDDLIVPAVAPHSMYTLDATTLVACRELAVRYDVPTLIHVAETQDEVTMSRGQHNSTPVAFLDSIGFLGPRVVLAHGVWVTDAEIDLIKRRGASLAHNPESNMKLASGAAPITKYLAAHVPVGLGTDGAASNNDLDMFEAMRVAAFLHKLVQLDPTVVSARTALEMATIGGARALGLDAQIGSLQPNKRADLVIVSMDSARQTPMYDPISHLVYATTGEHVRTSIINGKLVMRDRKLLTLDEGAVLAEARKLSEKVKEAVRPAPADDRR